VFLDPGALTFWDPDHSDDEEREITIGRSARRRVLFVAHTARPDGVRIITPGGPHVGNGGNVKKDSAKRDRNDLRPEYDLARLKGGVRGKYYAQATAGTNLVLLDPDVAKVFPDGSSVNRALRLLHEVATKSSRPTRTTASGRRSAAG
jgi:ribonuclease toxin BrnT of type II toxin-antitoxin system